MSGRTKQMLFMALTVSISVLAAVFFVYLAATVQKDRGAFLLVSVLALVQAAGFAWLSRTVTNGPTSQ